MRHKRLLCALLAVMIAALSIMPSFAFQASAAAVNPYDGTTTYNVNGNRIVDQYSHYNLNGYMVPYRLVRITPIKTSSKLHCSQATINVKDSAAQQAGVKKAIEIGSGLTLELLSGVPVVGTAVTFFNLAQTYKSIWNLPSSFSNTTVISNVTDTGLMAGSVSKVYLWVYWNGVWRKAYEGEQLIGSFDIACAFNLTGAQNMTKNVHGDIKKGSVSCNIGTQVKRMCTSNPPKAAYSLVGSAGVKFLGKWYYLSPKYYSALELGMKKFVSGTDAFTYQ